MEIVAGEVKGISPQTPWSHWYLTIGLHKGKKQLSQRCTGPAEVLGQSTGGTRMQETIGFLHHRPGDFWGCTTALLLLGQTSRTGRHLRKLPTSPEAMLEYKMWPATEPVPLGVLSSVTVWSNATFDASGKVFFQ